MRARSVCSVLAVVAMTSIASGARAADQPLGAGPPKQAFRLEAMIGFLYVPRSEDNSGASASAIGLRAGYRLGNGLYLGALFALYPAFFRSDVSAGCAEVCRGGPIPRGSESSGADIIAGEIGYEPSEYLRVYVGAGAMRSYGYSETSTPHESHPSPGFVAWPGAALSLPLFEHAFVGVDARYAIAIANVYAVGGINLFATWGVLF